MRCWGLILLWLIQTASVSAQTAADSMKEAVRLYQKGDLATARRVLEQTIGLALSERDRQTEAEARYQLGYALQKAAQYEASNSQLTAALPIFEEAGNREKVAVICEHLGTNSFHTGQPAESRRYFERALAISESLGDWKSVARSHLNLTYVSDDPGHIERGLEAARKSGDRGIEAALLHSWADGDYAADNFDAAFERLNRARTILEELGDRTSLARVFTSIGRLYRVHGHADQAFEYYRRGRDIQKEIGDVPGTIQSLNAMGVALNAMGRHEEALRYDQEALALARKTDSPRLIQFILVAIAHTQMDLGRTRLAAAAIEESRRILKPKASDLILLSEIRFAMGQYEGAREASDDSLAVAETGEESRYALTTRAHAFWKLGRTQEALRDIRQVMESVEQARGNLIPTDYMRQGFADTYWDSISLSLQIMLDSGEIREALETAEHARARAFLDLLASKSSDVSTGRFSAAATGEDLVALARRLNSTMLAYWVDETSTIIWTVSPNGEIAYARNDTGSSTLDRWIHDALNPGDLPREPRSASIVSRGGDVIVAAHRTRAAWRQLYNVLIRPVRANLPSISGSRLTIIPSGPLFRLSFAALTDEKGRYLIESYAVNYSPASEVFRYTREARKRSAGMPGRYLLVANPSGMPETDGRTLPALPEAETEVLAISRLATAGSTHILKGKQADEASVRAAMADARVIHLATHGVVDDANPLRSFLALSRKSAAPWDDGRLTAEEIYGLELHADLVVLSACRTGLGRISGDGVAGLARAFLYAGAATVVSTLWDVADQPTARLVEEFYRLLKESAMNRKSEALRNAQLRLLRSLRKGEVRVATPFGTLALPEDPIFWAGYVLIGEPE